MTNRSFGTPQGAGGQDQNASIGQSPERILRIRRAHAECGSYLHSHRGPAIVDEVAVDGEANLVIEVRQLGAHVQLVHRLDRR